MSELSGGSEGRRLARWAAEVRWESLDHSLKSKVRDHILDTVGVMCAGLETRHSRAIQQVVRGWGGVAESTVIGRGWRLPAPSAAMLNAFHARAHTFDDTHDVGPIHPGSAIVSAALACAEAVGAAGRVFLAGVIAGYEVATRVSAAVTPSHYGRGFHNTGTCNAFGACAAAGRILGFDAEAMAGALGLAGEGAAGLRQYQIDGSMTDTSLDGARAAHVGVVAAQLCAAGLPGPHGILDGPWGFCRVMAHGADLSRLDRGFGESYEFTGTAIKPFPSCRCTHGPIEALLTLRSRHAIDPREIEDVTIATFAHSIEVSDRPAIHNRFDAILSHQYCAAVVLLRGGLDLSDFEDARVADPATQALAAKVRVIHDASLEDAFPAAWPHRVQITLRNGSMYDMDSDNPPGTRDHPLTRGVIEEKFIRLSAPVLGRSRAEALRDALETLEHTSDTRALVPLLHPAMAA